MFNPKSTKEKIIKERVQLLLRYPFFGYLALGLEIKELTPEEMEALPPEKRTIGTDGAHLFYNPSFVDRLEPNVLRTIIAHETLHCALGHMWRKETRDKEKWNIAADYAANLLLKKEGFIIPTYILCDDQFEGMEAELIYSKLPDLLPKIKSFDFHNKWPKQGKQGKNSKSPDPKTEPGGLNGNMGSDPEQTEPETGKSQKGEKYNASRDKNLEDLWQERLMRAAMHARQQGNLPGIIDQFIQDMLQPKLNWRIILSEIIVSLAKNDFRLVPPSKKHLWRGIYLPSICGETLEIAVAIDTSGSISTRESQKLIAEIRGITEQFNDYIIHLFFCDAAIHERLALTPQDIWPEQFAKRDGGTNFIPVFEAIAEENITISALIYLTDGEGTYPETPPDYPVIWILTEECGKTPWGQKIVMEADK